MRCQWLPMGGGAVMMVCGRGVKPVKASKKPLQIKYCEACGASMVFLKASAGRWMPTDVETVAPEDRTFDPSRHVSHWATCPEAARFRKGGER